MSVFGEHPLLEDANEEPFFVVDAYVTLVSVGRAGEPQRLHTSLQPTSEVEQSRMEVRTAAAEAVDACLLFQQS